MLAHVLERFHLLESFLSLFLCIIGAQVHFACMIGHHPFTILPDNPFIDVLGLRVE